MDANEFLAERFEEHRGHLRAVAYRMLGSVAEADDAVQESWLRLSRTDAERIDNLGGWLTTVTGRVCLDMLRSRTSRREDPLRERLPDPVLGNGEGTDPEQEVLIADSVGLALLVVLESLKPAERLAFVLHDMFGVPFEEIAPIVDRTPVAAKKLASRARERIRGSAPEPEPDPDRQRAAVEAFLAAARGGDFDALLTVLDPDVEMRVDAGGGLWRIRGAAAVAGQADTFRRMSTLYDVEVVPVNGVYGLTGSQDGELRSVLSFAVAGGRIISIDLLSDPERIAALINDSP